MKNWSLIALLLFSLAAYAQTDSTAPPYKRFPKLPPVKLLLNDSVTVFTKENIPENKAVFLVLFSPDCSHCQQSTEQIIAHKDELKDLQILMITMQTLEKMRAFISQYKLNDLPNVVVGKDLHYITPVFYNIKNLPFLAMYNKKGELITGVEGALGIPQVIQIFKTHK